MKKQIVLAAMAAMVSAPSFAQTDPYVVELKDAVWNFDDYSDTKGVTAGNENFVCPNNWFVGNAGTGRVSPAYLPYIYPSKLEQEKTYGYDGRLCERIYGLASKARVPVYAILPTIKDKEYNNLVLNFYGKGEKSITSTPYYANLRIGYLEDIADTANLKSSFAEKVVHFKDTILSQEQYDKYEILLKGIPDNAHVVLYDDDDTKINSCLLDNISFTEVKSSPSTSSVLPIEKENAVKIMREGQLLILRDGRLYNMLGALVE